MSGIANAANRNLGTIGGNFTSFHTSASSIDRVSQETYPQRVFCIYSTRRTNNMNSGLNYLSTANLAWQRVDVHGASMDKAVLFEGSHGVRSAFFKMPAGLTIPGHTHTKWVQVMVLEGCMRVEQKGSEVIDAPSGCVYFLDPGYPHVETALEDTVVLVTQGEDRPGWM